MRNLTVLKDVQSDEYQKKQLLRQAMLLLPEDKLERLKEILARTKDVDEGIRQFRKFREDENGTMTDGNGKYVVVQGETELLRRLENGWRLAQPLNGDKYLLRSS